MALTDDQALLQHAVRDLDTVEAEINRRRQPVPPTTKQVDFRIAQTFKFDAPSMVAQRKTYVNGADDAYFDYLSYSVMIGFTQLSESEAGFYNPLPPVLTDETIPRSMVAFDFFWNFAVSSTREKYASSANDVNWISRRSLGNRDRNQVLTFLVPLRLKGGDSIALSVKPAFYGYNTVIEDSYDYEVFVTMTLHGRRNGRMAESNFDPDFRPSYRSNK